jgi:hypothetical protein
MKKVKHLVELPGAKSKLSLWKADLDKEGSFDEAIKGCTGVFHVATPMDFESKDPEVYMLNNKLLFFNDKFTLPLSFKINLKQLLSIIDKLIYQIDTSCHFTIYF